MPVKRGRPRSTESPTRRIPIFLDDRTIEQIDAYAERIYGHHDGKRNATIHHVLRSVMDIFYDPQVQSTLDGNFVYRSEPMALLRQAMVNYLKSNVDESTDFDLQ